MITHTHRPLRVILYEGTGSIALPAESRAKVMMALLDKGYAVTRSGQGASAVPHDDRSLLVLGAFEGKAPALEDATGQITIDTRDITGLAPDADFTTVHKAPFLWEVAKAQGYVETVFGRRLYLPEINSPNGPRRSGAERAAINAPMQGTAADLIKLSMNAVQKVLDDEKRGTKMIMQVHDELVFEVPEAEVAWLKTEIPRLMAGVAALKVPLLAEVGVGPNWDKAH